MSFLICDAPWDTEYFGYPCAKAELTDILTPKALDAFLEQTKKYRFITVSNPEAFVQNNAVLQQLPGAVRADVNILLRNRAPAIFPAEASCGMALSLAFSAALGDISGSIRGAFSASRFYHDPHIGKSLADGIYLSWIQNAQKKEDRYFCTCTVFGAFAGLILFRRDASDTVLIELIFTDSAHRGKGVGSAMMRRLQTFCAENGIQNILVGTQQRNETALRFYRKHGFCDEKVTHIFHLWNQ